MKIRVLSHTTVGSNDLGASGRSYDAVLIPLGLRRRQDVPDGGPAAGGGDSGGPGPRLHYGEGYHGEYLVDPDGNKVHLAYRGDLAEYRTARPRRQPESPR
jgi:hypothetical protein